MEQGEQDQHIIPKSYLRKFTKEGNGFFYQLKVLDPKFSIREVHVNNTCYVTNFYDIKSKDDLISLQLSDARYIETSFTYENLIPNLLERIQQKEKFLSNKDVHHLVEAYISFKHRVPKYRKEITKINKEGRVFDQTAGKLKVELKKLIEYHNFDFDAYAMKLKRDMQNDPQYSESMHKMGLVESIRKANIPVNDAILKVSSMNISVLNIRDKNDYLLVSDNPGFSLLGNMMFNTNYGNFDTIIWPINSKQAIRFFGFDRLNHVRPLRRIEYEWIDPSYIKSINAMTFLVADEKIFCEDRDFLESFRKEISEIKDEQNRLLSEHKKLKVN